MEWFRGLFKPKQEQVVRDDYAPRIITIPRGKPFDWMDNALPTKIIDAAAERVVCSCAGCLRKANDILDILTVGQTKYESGRTVNEGMKRARRMVTQERPLRREIRIWERPKV